MGFNEFGYLLTAMAVEHAKQTVSVPKIALGDVGIFHATPPTLHLGAAEAHLGRLGPAVVLIFIGCVVKACQLAAHC